MYRIFAYDLASQRLSIIALVFDCIYTAERFSDEMNERQDKIAYAVRRVGR